MRSHSEVGPALTGRPRHFSMMGDTPAMPLKDAHFGGFFVSGVGPAAPHLQKAAEYTREGVRA